MLSRRIFIRTAVGAAGLGLFARRSMAQVISGQGCQDTGSLPLLPASPFARVPHEPPSQMVDGLPFAKLYTGDKFDNHAIPFHGNADCFEGDPPAPTEYVDVVVVGGGISGLCAAYLLRAHRPILFELRDHFGGSAQGECWNGSCYSLGNAYVITPDPGTFLEDIYTQLGLPHVINVDDGRFSAELNGNVIDDLFHGAILPSDVAEAFQQYRQIVLDMAYNNYPDIPLPQGKNNDWILKLDQKSLRQDIEERMTVPVPDLLAAAIQAYCYSSFAAGWEEISAASGWNFLAAEEFARWVCPGGNAYMAYRFWQELANLEKGQPPGCSPQHLRAGCIVVDVRLTPDGRVQVTYKDSNGGCRSLSAKKVVMACPKLTAKYILHDAYALDEAKYAAMKRLEYRAYLVINVLLDGMYDLGFYDVFLMGDGTLPMNQEEAEAGSRIIDVLNGSFAESGKAPGRVLTLYWPLPFDVGRWTLYMDDAWHHYAQSAAGQIKKLLEILGIKSSAVKQVRMTRWGHAMPIARVGLIADGTTEALRRPIEDKIYFINQDNWALPAVENCLLDAEIYVPQIKSGL